MKNWKPEVKASLDLLSRAMNSGSEHHSEMLIAGASWTLLNFTLTTDWSPLPEAHDTARNAAEHAAANAANPVILFMAKTFNQDSWKR